MGYENFSDFIKDFCTYPLSLVLLAIIIIFLGIWFFKIRPKEQKQKMQSEREFLKAQQRYEYLTETQTKLYQTALDNSTKAIENNTAVVKVFTERMKALEENQKANTTAIRDLQLEDRRLVEKALENNTLLKNGRD